MGGNPFFPNERKPIRLWRSETVRVGFWIMWAGEFYCPARRLVDRLRREGNHAG